MGYLNPGTFLKHGHYGQDQILRTIRYGPNVFVDVFDKIKCPARRDDESLSL